MIESHWRRVFHFAFRMTLERDRARDVVEETFLRAYNGSGLPPEAQIEPWLLRIAAHVVEKKVGEGPPVTFEQLDETLRSEATRTDVCHSLSQPERNFMLWELKQGCMTSVVNCLTAGERIAFVLHVILGYTEDDAAHTLNITTAAFKVRLSRARKKVTDYLAPRCEHVNPGNPCRCPSRLGVAMTRGFLPVVQNARVTLRKDFGRYGSLIDGEDAPLRDVIAIYQSLPEPDLPVDLPASLFEKLDSGAWAGLKSAAASRGKGAAPRT